MDKKLKLFLKKYEEEVDFDSQSIMPEGCKVLVTSKHRSRNKCVLASVISSCTCVAVALGIAIPVAVNYGRNTKFEVNDSIEYIKDIYSLNNVQEVFKLISTNDIIMEIFYGQKNDIDYLLYICSVKDAIYNFEFNNISFVSENFIDLFQFKKESNMKLSFSILNESTVLLSTSININI